MSLTSLSPFRILPAPIKVPYFGKHLMAGGKGAIEYLPILEWRDVRLMFDARADAHLVCADICGDSLIEAGIFDGDEAVIELASDAADGDLVAALTPEGLIVKYLYREPRGFVRLESRNAACRTLHFHANQVQVQGVLRQITRKLGR